MALDPQLVRHLKQALQQARDTRHDAWEASRKLTGAAALPSTLRRLSESIRESNIEAPLKDALLEAVSQEEAENRRVRTAGLKDLTGLPTAKALRALCVLFDLVADRRPSRPLTIWSPEDCEAFVRLHPNPFDLLREIDVASVLDLGAGDLSFAVELVERYLPSFEETRKELVLHSVDRLQHGSQFGGRLHADPSVVRKLVERGAQREALAFRFWPNQDMFGLDSVKEIWPCYSLVTCHGPATPTFAYEPSRLSSALIHDHLEKTKGRFRRVKVKGEDALEVLHAGRRLLFPPWKFDIIGPLALLNLVAQRGKVCLLTSIDSEVFWEVLSQLLEGDRFRPREILLTPSTLPDVLGEVYRELNALPVGASRVLSEIAPVRSIIPGVGGRTYRFRYVEVRRGAVFEDMPASQTARLFEHMTEEQPPWLLILIPDAGRAASS